MESSGKRKACMLAYTFYENDGRVMRYAEALAQNGYVVEAIVLRRDQLPEEEMLNGVKVLRIQSRVKNETGKFSYLSRILKFFLRSFYVVSRRHIKEPYDLIHVHSVPDFEVFAASFAKLRGAKVILDVHDIVPEFYAAKFNVSHSSLVFKTLKLIEKISSAFADHVIIANDIWRDKITKRSVSLEKCSSFINYPDTTTFHPGLKTRGNDGKFIMVYPGTLNWHQGLDIAIKAFDIAKDSMPDSELHIYGEGSARTELDNLIKTLGLESKVFLNNPMPLKQIASIMAHADLGIVPKRNDSFGGEAFSTKILEFMALGVPVLIADTKIDTHYFNESLVMFFKAGDENHMAQGMIEAFRNRDRLTGNANRGLEFANQNSWKLKQKDYLEIVRRLLSDDAVVK